MNKTKPSIVESYIKLINDEKYDKVSITDLVSENQVSRQTFYYHFDDINDMLPGSILCPLVIFSLTSNGCSVENTTFKCSIFLSLNSFLITFASGHV